MSAGYSGTPLPRKLGIRDGHRVAVVGDPGHATRLLDGAPDDLAVAIEPDIPAAPARGTDDAFDVVLCFIPRLALLEERFAAGARLVSWSGGVWACWPKKRSPLHEDLAETQVREHGLANGLVDNKICAVDDDWSGLRFVHRVADRP